MSSTQRLGRGTNRSRGCTGCGRLLIATPLLLALSGWTTGCRAEEPSEQSAPAGPAGVHRSPLAGSWYPADPVELRTLIQDLLAREPPSDRLLADSLVALVVPHAAYAYSGPTAAAGYRILARRAPKRVVLLGPTHYVSFRGLSLAHYSAYETPLGRVPVDPEARRLLSDCPHVSFLPAAHEREHALDVQIPFLQVLFSPPPSIVPLVVGEVRDEEVPALARCLSALLDDRTVVLASTDFTHYGPRFAYVPFAPDGFAAEKIRVLDEGAIREILEGGVSGFLDYRKRTGITVCGYRPVALLMQMLPPDARGQLLSYDTSGRMTGDDRHSVSYATLSFHSEAGWNATAAPGPSRAQERDPMPPKNDRPSPPAGACEPLTPPERAALLRLARDTLEQYVRAGKRPDPDAPSYAVSPRLGHARGAFVTLKKQGNLRGCIGYIQPVEPLLRTVQENTINACSRDTRFSPVQPGELADIRIEISALTVPEPVPSYRQIEVGRHGIVLRSGSSRAVFLPQVAVEQGWDIEQTLRELARKAGLSPAAWKAPDTRYEVFTAEIIEEEPGSP